MSYSTFISDKTQSGADHGFEADWFPDSMFDFQRALTSWAVEKGRSAIFADCGLGKSVMQLTFAENVARKTGKPVLILTPLAVSHQTVEEANKFGVEATRSSDGTVKGRIVVTNYERLHNFNPHDFSGVVCDESSILKAFDGTRRKEITEFMRKTEYRLLCTATAAPNDYIELGTSSEALGYLGYTDMLTRFFKNENNSVRPFVFGLSRNKNEAGTSGKWRFRGHAETPFWRWVVSWARAARKPSDLGFDDGPFILPTLTEETHVVSTSIKAPGMLFNLPAIGLREQRDERRRSIGDRCKMAADLVRDTGDPALVWCHLNDEGDMLEKMIPGSVQVAGKHTDEQKEDRFLDFARGNTRVLITKPKIGAWGLNFQHCAHIVCFPSHSFEAHYQGIRRCWRFGQKRPVKVDAVASDGEVEVVKNLARKGERASKMFENLVSEMNNELAVSARPAPTIKEEMPSWL